MSEKDNDSTEQTGGEDKTEENESAENELDPKTVLAQKERFREKYQKEAEEKSALQKELEELKSSQKKEETTDDKKKDVGNISEERIEAIEFTLRHPEIDSKISLDVLEVARVKGINPDEALELPYFKTYLEKKEEERKSSDAVPSSGRSPKVTPEKPISEMTQEEHRKLWESYRK